MTRSRWEDGWDPHEILILSPRRAAAASRAECAVADALAHHDGDANGTQCGTVHAYKWLIDVDGAAHWEELIYIGGATECLLCSPDRVMARTPAER